jgi:cell pole-organizing protein PopZ
MHNTGELPSGSIEVFDDPGDMLADFADGPLPASIEQLMSRDLVDQMVAEAVRRHLEQRLPGLVERLVDEALKKRGS